MAVSVVQSKFGTSSSITFDSNVTAGNSVIVCTNFVGAAGTADVTGVTIGGSADNFAEVVEASVPNAQAAIWADHDAAGGSANISISGSNLDNYISVAAYEVTPVLTDVSSSDNSGDSGSNTDWSSGSVGTNYADEIWIGDARTGYEVTGPGSPWTDNEWTYAVTGYRVVSSTGSPEYAGTQPYTGSWAACVAAFYENSTLHADVSATTTGTAAVAATRVDAADVSATVTATATAAATRVGHADVSSTTTAAPTVAATGTAPDVHVDVSAVTTMAATVTAGRLEHADATATTTAIGTVSATASTAHLLGGWTDLYTRLLWRW